MADLIDRQAVIQMFNVSDRFVAESLRLCDTDIVFSQNEVFIVDDMYENLEQLPSAQQWIPCSERRAEFPCLACDTFGQIFIPTSIATLNGKCYDGRQYRMDAEAFLRGEVVETAGGMKMRILPQEIIAWMPLPKPYEVTP